MQNIVTQKSRNARRRARQQADIGELRTQVGDALNRLSAQLIARVSEAGIDPRARSRDPVTAALQARVARLGQLAAGLAIVDPECLPARGAGFGATVELTNVADGERARYTLMVGSLVDIDADQVSLASPIGQALLGKEAGQEITIATPQREARFAIDKVVTLADWLAEI